MSIEYQMRYSAMRDKAEKIEGMVELETRRAEKCLDEFRKKHPELAESLDLRNVSDTLLGLRVYVQEIT